MTDCIHHNCSRAQGKAAGYCDAHYARRRLGRDMDAPIRNSKATDQERFWSKVEKGEGCWLWRGSAVNGYGIFRLGGRNCVAHRVAYEWARGPIPEGQEVDHMCFNHSCVNPSHHRLLSHSANGQNRVSANSNSKSGIRGVYWVEARKGWMAAGMLNRIVHRMGPFPTAEEANSAIVAWRHQHMPASIKDRKQVVS